MSSKRVMEMFTLFADTSTLKGSFLQEDTIAGSNRSNVNLKTILDALFISPKIAAIDTTTKSFFCSCSISDIILFEKARTG
jgi:redox-regulated HSP33 family molecular chaperone